MKNWLYPFWVIINLLLYVAILSLWITAPEFKTLNIILTIFSFALSLLLMILKSEELKIFLKTGYFKKIAYHGTNIFLIFCILAVMNYLGNKNYKEMDLSIQKRNSLTDQTKKIIGMVKFPLKMTVFAKRDEWNAILSLLKLYSAESKKIDIEAIDTDVRPDIVKAKNVSQNGTVIINYQGKETSFVLVDELSVTNALLKTLRTESINLYFVTGHQELSCSETAPEGISTLCDKLRSQNYEIRELDLTKVSEVPKDATAVFVLGPTSGFFKSEANILKKYVQNNGHLFLALAPAFKSDLYENLIDIVKPYGLELGNDIVIDRLSTVQGAEATIPIVNKYEPQHPITENFNLRTVFPLSSSVKVLPDKDTASILAFTSFFPASWAEKNLKAVTEGKAQFDEKFDTKGPVGLIGVAEGAGQSTSRIILLGSSSFLINAYQTQSGNTTLFLNAVSWIVNDEGIISLNRPGIDEYPVILSAQHLQMIFVISILVVPIIFFGTAILIYRRRRIL
jgi:ABC-type uncharacterized transport system involved in gliding motility auxiliary subunit